MGSRAAIFVVEGVLAEESGLALTARPIIEGKMLFKSLEATGHKAIFYSDKLFTERDQLVNWLVINLLLRDTPHIVQGMTKLEAITTVRSLGYDLQYYVDASPADCATAMNAGVPTLLFAHPSYARPEFRPDAPSEMREWAMIEQEIEEQRSLLANDDRRRDQASRRFVD